MVGLGSTTVVSVGKLSALLVVIIGFYRVFIG